MSPKISVIVPVYNVEKYLKRCIDSILAQTYKDFEIILVDDGSPDNSGAICDEYAKRDNRVETFHNVNMGAGAAREFGVSKACGKWIMFVDADDTIPEMSLEKLINQDNGSFEIISGICHNQTSNTYYTHKREGSLTNQEYICALLIGETLDGPWAKIIQRSLFSRYRISTPKKIRQNEDMLMLIGLSINANHIFLSNDIVAYNYIYRPNSARTSLMPVASWLELFSYIKVLLKDNYTIEISYSFMKYCLTRLRWCHDAGYFTPISNPQIKEIYLESAQFSDDEFIGEARKKIASTLFQVKVISIRKLKSMIKKLLRI